jgi:hypothetical protein
MGRTAERPPGFVEILETATAPAVDLEVKVDESPGFLLQIRTDPIARNCALLLLAGVLWQVFALGFYLDDWSLIVKTAREGAGLSLERWQAVRLFTLPRPSEAPLWYILTSLLGDQTILWHIALLGVNILLASLLFNICLRLRLDDADRITRVVFLSVLFWFILPWNACLHFWPTEILAVLMLDLFCLVYASCGSGLDEW